MHANRYLEQQVATASPAMLTAMLFDAIVANSLRAVDSLVADDKITARRSLIKAQEIVLELRSTLNHEAGGEIARNLDRLYDFTYQKLLEGSLRGDQASVLAAVDVIAPLRDSWRTACVESAVAVP
jgi:flagellar protein FliS